MAPKLLFMILIASVLHLSRRMWIGNATTGVLRHGSGPGATLTTWKRFQTYVIVLPFILMMGFLDALGGLWQFLRHLGNPLQGIIETVIRRETLLDIEVGAPTLSQIDREGTTSQRT